MNRYCEFIGSMPQTPGFKQVLPILLVLQVLIGVLNSYPILFLLSSLLSLCISGFWIEYLSRAIKCEEFAFPRFENNIKKFISLGFRFGLVNMLYTLPFVILTIVTVIVGVGFIKTSIQDGDISTLVPEIIFITAIALLWVCFVFYIFPLVSVRFAVTKSVYKTLNIKRIYVLWYKSQSIYRKMFQDIVVVSTIFFIAGIMVLLLPVMLVSGSIATMVAHKMNPLELIMSSGASFGMGIVLGIALYVALALLIILGSFAMYKIVATYYRIPPKSETKNVAEVH